MNRNLTIMLPTRDRTYLTLKTIESLHQNTKNFTILRIYVFDNLSNVDDKSRRLETFQRLIFSNKISHYSYDTPESTHHCFPKAFIFQQWLLQMKMNKLAFHNKYSKDEDYYLLIDNDMLVGPNWDDYFLSTCDVISKFEPNVHFITKYPGGIVGSSSQLQISNTYNRNEVFNIKMGNAGGGSGFWFFNYPMLLNILEHWTPQRMKIFKNKFKGHDTFTWEHINKDHKGTCKYVCGIIPPNEKENPLVLHLGPVLGSICNKLVKNDYTKDIQKELELKEESLIKNLTSQELFEKYKNSNNRW